jgi:branched-chain amino acid transport system substrate-binding protein
MPPPQANPKASAEDGPSASEWYRKDSSSPIAAAAFPDSTVINNEGDNQMINQHTGSMSRRSVLQQLAAGAALTSIGRPSFATPATVTIGLVAPQTGPLALFNEEMAYALEHARRTLNNSIRISGTVHPLEFIVKDSQSNPNRAAEVTQELILKHKVHLVLTFATPETVNPVSDQCELNGMPCVSSDDPLEPYFFGRNGDLKKGFEWTYNFFFSGVGLLRTHIAGWSKVPSNKVLGVLWANDDDGRTFAKVMPPTMVKNGLKVIDAGRFDLPASDFSPEIAAFKAANVEIVFTVIPGPDFTVFLNQAAQQGLRPKIITAGKVAEFPQGVYPYGDRAINMLTEVWWSKYHPYASGLTSQSAMEYATEYEKSTKKQASMGLGFRHALIEVAVDALKRSERLDDPSSIRDAVRATDYKSIVETLNFNTGPFPNTSETKCVAGQWRKGKDWPLELVIVENSQVPDVPLQGAAEAMA